MLLVGIFGGTAIVVLLLAYLAGPLAAYIPFSVERHFAARFAPQGNANKPLLHYLQGIANRIAKAEQLPPGMHITVHYVDSDTVNAFATLGGHVVFYRGLLERLPDENALAMVMGHEIAHIKDRDPIRSLGRGMVIAITISLVDSSVGTALANEILGQTGLLTQLSFSRQQESAADRIGQAALENTYGGVHGVDELFHAIEKAEQGKAVPSTEIYRSHPDTAARLAALHRQARAHGWPEGTTTPLPTAFSKWIKAPPIKQPSGADSAKGRSSQKDATCNGGSDAKDSQPKHQPEHQPEHRPEQLKSAPG